MRFITCN